MIIWKCDGCGKTKESMYGNRLDKNTFHPVPPIDWWVADLYEYDSYLLTRRSSCQFAMACCGACVDLADKSLRKKFGKIELYWTGHQKS